MTLTIEQNEFLTNNGFSVTEENGTFTLHYPDHKCGGLSAPEIDHILNEYISGKYCSLRPKESEYTSTMERDD
jgi:hypothetical protein